MQRDERLVTRRQRMSISPWVGIEEGPESGTRVVPLSATPLLDPEKDRESLLSLQPDDSDHTFPVQPDDDEWSDLVRTLLRFRPTPFCLIQVGQLDSFSSSH